MDDNASTSLDDIPTDVDSLSRVLEAMKAAAGGLQSLACQVSQMRGMFDDEDGTIEEAVEDGEHAEAFLQNAISHVQGLLADENGSRIVDDERTHHQTDVVRQAAASAVSFPTAEALLRAREELLCELGVSADRNEGDGTVEITLDDANVELIAGLLEGAARSAATPVEIAVHVDGGNVQDVVRTDDETRLVHVYVHDHDGHDKNEDDGHKDTARIEFENSDEGVASPCSLTRHDGGPYETAPRQGRYFSSLRAEADRLRATA